jgi:Mn-dependent DtxR family transcriptional regulator
MLITRRRLQFMQTIQYLYESENKPVHYVQVAESMGISKWSAYEMLKRLKGKGS